jgi:hypothetical protein
MRNRDPVWWKQFCHGRRGHTDLHRLRSVLVPWKNGLTAGEATVKTRAIATAGGVDNDKLKLVCLPPR